MKTAKSPFPLLHIGGLHLQDHAQGDVQGAMGLARISDACHSELPRCKLVAKLHITNAYLHLVLVPREVLMTRVIDLYLLCDTEMRKREGLRRALLVEDTPTIATVVLSIGE